MRPQLFRTRITELFGIRHPILCMLGKMVQAPLAADAVKLPLAIGGGMATGRHLVTALAMGADAILLGSRMLTASEIWAHPRYKERILAAMKIFRRHHRVLDNEAARSVEDGVADFEAYRPLVTGRVTREAYETGDLSQGMLDLAPGGVFAREIKPVEAIFDELIDEAGSAIDRLERLGVPL